MALKKFCRKQGCKEYGDDDGYCSKHKREAHSYDQYRGTAAERGYDSKWRKARLGYLKKHPLCVECERNGVVRAATEIDHIRAHRGDKELFWDSKNNWMALCKGHHSQKTIREDGGFGRKKK
jgi:5-methylcytosine-specific restriction protein A